MNYFDLKKYVSNSDLSELRRAMNNVELPKTAEFFNFGKLVDGMVTTPNKVNDIHNALSNDYEETIFYEKEKFLKAEQMTAAFHADPILKGLCKDMRFQYVYTRERFEIEFEGFAFYIPVRCMFDGINRGLMGLELKTTTATKQSQFDEAIDFFDWDRAAAWYMDIAKLDNYILAGISKGKKPTVFRKAVQRGDEFYNRGKLKYQRLALQYYFLIYQLFQDEI